MNEIQRIVDQLQRAFEGNAWHGPAVLEVLGDVDASKASAKPVAGAHSIWELVHHIRAWEGFVRRRIDGEVIVDVADDDDWPPVREISGAAWTKALDELERGHTLLRETISQMNESRLQDQVPGKDYLFYVMLHGVVQHDLYHAGQIALLKRISSL